MSDDVDDQSSESEESQPAEKKTPTPNPKSRRPRLTDDQWKEAVRLRTETTMPTHEIAAKLGCDTQNLANRFTRHGIYMGSAMKEAIEARQQAVVEASRNGYIELIEKARKMEKQNLDAMQALQTAVIGLVVDNQKKGRDPAAMLDGQKSLGQTIKNLQMARVTAVEILQEYRDHHDEEIPVLEIRTMTQEDVEAERTRQELEDLEIGDGGGTFYEDQKEDDDDAIVEIKDE